MITQVLGNKFGFKRCTNAWNVCRYESIFYFPRCHRLASVFSSNTVRRGSGGFQSRNLQFGNSADSLATISARCCRRASVACVSKAPFHCLIAYCGLMGRHGIYSGCIPFPLRSLGFGCPKTRERVPSPQVSAMTTMGQFQR